MRERSALVACLMVVALGACAGSDAPPATTVQDSAGIRIVVHDADTEVPSWTIRATKTLEGDPETPLFEIGAALRLADGRYVVADGGNARVVVYDATGSIRSTAGRAGEGPGEYVALHAVFHGAGDSILAWDRRQRRISVLTSDGAFARSFALETTDDVPFASVADVYSDGSFLATGFVQTGGGGPEAGRRIYPIPSFHFAANGDFVSTAGEHDSGESFYEIGDRGFSVWVPLFGRDSFRGAAGDRYVTAVSDVYEVRFRDPDGTLTSILRRTPRARPVTGEARARVVEHLVEEARAGQAERLRSVLKSMEVPELLPEFADLFSDPLGRVWLREYQVVPGSDAEWWAWGPDGEALGALVLPATFEPMDAGDDWILGVVRDEFDVESVVEVSFTR